MSVWRSSTTGILIAGVVLIILAAAAAFILANFQPTTEVRLGSGVYKAKLATTEPARVQGLSGVANLRADDALLMAFNSDDNWEIWMKDMKVPIDIIWLDSKKTVIYTVTNAKPELSTDKVFKPTEKARYVLEIPAGSAAKNNIKTGDKAEFTVTGEIQ